MVGTASRILWQVLTDAYRELGFDALDDEAFAAMVLARLIQPVDHLDEGLRGLVELSGVRSNGHMANARSTWNDAGERFQALGASLKQHYLQQRESEADRDKEQAADAFTKVGDALQAAFDALANAANDPTVKNEVKQASISVADALSVTFAEVSEDLSRAFDSAPPAAEPGAAEQSPQDQKDPGASN